MKKVYQLMAAASLSLLTIAATAQSYNPFVATGKANTFHKAKFGPFNVPGNKNANAKASNTNRVMSGASYAHVEYLNLDNNLLGSGYSLQGAPGYYIEQTNHYFIKTDTGATATKNYDLCNNPIVAFDTIIDSMGTPYLPGAGTLTIDTLKTVLGYLHTSGQPDTIFFQICQVQANGYPTGTVWKQDTLVISDVLFGGGYDTLYNIFDFPNFTVPTGYRFCVNISFHGPKTDTLMFCFGFPMATCSSPMFNYANQYTYFGMPFKGAVRAGYLANSYMNGWSDYQTSGNPVIWPNAKGQIYGSFGTLNFWNICAPSDTMWFYQQDIELEAFVSFTNVQGVTNINGTDFSIGQNFPNPFNHQTTITYNLSKSSDVVFTVHDMAGRELVNNSYSTVGSGKHQITLAANQFSPGVYFYTFNVNGTPVTHKMVITQ